MCAGSEQQLSFWDGVFLQPDKDDAAAGSREGSQLASGNAKTADLAGVAAAAQARKAALNLSAELSRPLTGPLSFGGNIR